MTIQLVLTPAHQLFGFYPEAHSHPETPASTHEVCSLGNRKGHWSVKASRKEGELKVPVSKTLHAYIIKIRRNDFFFDQEVTYNVSH